MVNTTAFLNWWKEIGQYDCAMKDNSPEEYKRILLLAWEQGEKEAAFRYKSREILNGNKRLKCPQCGRLSVIYTKKEDRFWCKLCGNSWQRGFVSCFWLKEGNICGHAR